MAYEAPKADSKGKAALIVAALGKPTKEEAPETGEADNEDMEAAQDDAVKSMMGALKSGNSKEFKDALKDFISMCGY